MIEVKKLTKMYGSKTALDKLDLTIQSGAVYGLLGHNGAGKSTLIKMLVSILNPTSGTIVIDGKPLDTNRQELKQQIGYVPDSPDLFLQLSAHEYWSLMAAAYNIPKELFQQRLAELVDRFSMGGHQTETIASFSHGMRQKTMIIGALLSDPDIWILDEPLQGLDPQAAFDLKEMITLHAKKGKTVIFSTHVLDSAEQLCDSLAILKQGNLLYDGSVSDLLATHPNQSLETIYLSLTGRQATDTSTEQAVSEPEVIEHD